MEYGCLGSNGIYFGYKKSRLHFEENETITYLFTPKLTQSEKFFKYMERNFEGQYYRRNRQNSFSIEMSEISIDEKLSYLNNQNNGQERIQGDNLTCTDNSVLRKGKNPKEVQCELPTENATQTCVTITNTTLNPLLDRRCSASNTYDIPFSHCQFKKSKKSKEESCSCYCHAHHNCNNFVPKCKLENMFVMHEHAQDTEYEVAMTPALDTDPVEFLRYMKSRYFTKGYEKNTRAPNTTTTTTTTSTTTTTFTFPVITSNALTVHGSTTHLFLLISSLAMMYSKMHEIK